MNRQEFLNDIQEPDFFEKIEPKLPKSGIISLLTKLFSIAQLVNGQCLIFDTPNFTLGYNKFSYGVQKSVLAKTLIPICNLFVDKTCNSTNYQNFIDSTVHTTILFYNNIRTNLYNFDNPIEYFEVSTDEKILDLNKDFEYVIKLKENQITTNTNYYAAFLPPFIFNNIVVNYTTVTVELNEVKREKTNIDPSTGIPYMGINIVFDRDPEILSISRGYNRMDEVLANVFAALDLLQYVCELFFSIYNYKRYEYRLLNELYYINDDLSEKVETPENEDKNIDIDDIVSKNSHKEMHILTNPVVELELSRRSERSEGNNHDDKESEKEIKYNIVRFQSNTQFQNTQQGNQQQDNQNSQNINFNNDNNFNSPNKSTTKELFSASKLKPNETNEIDENDKIPISNNRELSNLKPYSKFFTRDIVPINNNEKLRKIKHYIKKKRLKNKKPKLLTCMFCEDELKNDDVTKTFLIGEKLLEYDFNIINIMKKLFEYEKIKQLIFNKSQIEGLKLIKRTRKIDTNLDLEEKVNDLNDNLSLKTKNDIDNEYLNYLNFHINNLKVSKDEMSVKILNEMDLNI